MRNKLLASRMKYLVSAIKNLRNMISTKEMASNQLILKQFELVETRLLAIQASYKALIETISLEELEVNKVLRNEIRKIRRQIQMIEEMNQSFEY